MDVQAKLLRTVFNGLRSNPCRLDLGLFETHADKLTLAAWIVNQSEKSDLCEVRISPNEDYMAQAAQLLNLDTEEAIRLLRVTYWNEPFASACIFSAYEFLDELAEYKFRFNLTETQEINCRNVLRLFAYQAIVEICILRISFFFATGKTDEVESFNLEKAPFVTRFVKPDQLLMKVDYWRHFPVKKVNNILRFRHDGWLLSEVTELTNNEE